MINGDNNKANEL